MSNPSADSGTPRSPQGSMVESPGALPVVYETTRFVVIDKPSGLLSVPGRSPGKEDCVRARVQLMYPDATGPMTVHRLDLETSGLIVLALDPEAHRDLSIQFEKRSVRKLYRALVEGDIENDSGKIMMPLSKDWPNRPKQKVDFDTGKAAVTHFEVETRFGHATRIRMIPVTGRSHQLRVHAAHELGLNAPILGDPLYGDESKAPRLLLHACELELNDPDTRERLTITSEAPF